MYIFQFVYSCIKARYLSLRFSLHDNKYSTVILLQDCWTCESEYLKCMRIEILFYKSYNTFKSGPL